MIQILKFNLFFDLIDLVLYIMNEFIATHLLTYKLKENLYTACFVEVLYITLLIILHHKKTDLFRCI